MTARLQLFAHPFSSYCWKVLIALYENDLAFDYRPLDPEHPENGAEWARRWPLRKMPLLVHGEHAVSESSIIVEYLQLHFPGPARLVPDDPASAIEVRHLDRVFDGYVMTPMGRIVVDAMRADGAKDPQGVADAHVLLAQSYGWLDTALRGRHWAAGDAFTLADCAAAPALFYADWVHPIGPEHAALAGYRARLLDRPSVKRAVDEARPYRHLFPPGAPDRD